MSQMGQARGPSQEVAYAGIGTPECAPAMRSTRPAAVSASSQRSVSQMSGRINDAHAGCAGHGAGAHGHADSDHGECAAVFPAAAGAACSPGGRAKSPAGAGECSDQPRAGPAGSDCFAVFGPGAERTDRQSFSAGGSGGVGWRSARPRRGKQTSAMRQSTGCRHRAGCLILRPMESGLRRALWPARLRR